MPPKAPERAPFFLPTIPGAQPKFATPTTMTNEMNRGSHEDSRVLNFAKMDSESDFWKTLQACHEINDCECLFFYKLFYSKIARALIWVMTLDATFYQLVKNASPANLDLELRTMNTMDSGASILRLLKALSVWLETRHDFEVVETLLHVFLRVSRHERSHLYGFFTSTHLL